MTESAPHNEPLYNSRIIDTYLKLLQKRCSQVDLDDLLHHGGMTRHEVLDPGHWFTQEQVDLFHERLVQMTGEEDIAREAGRFAASPESLGLMRQYVFGMVGPAYGFRFLNRIAAMLTRSASYDSRRLGANKVEVVVRVKEGVKEKPFQCANRTGYLEAMVTLFTNRLPEVAHPECIFAGGNVCRYEISWEKTRSDLWKGICTRGIPFIFALSLIALFIMPLAALIPLLLASTAAALVLALIAEHTKRQELSEAIGHLQDSSETLIRQAESNYNNALMVNEIGQIISRQTDIDDILDQVVHVLEKRLDYDRGILLLASGDRTRLQLQTGFGYTPELEAYLRESNFSLDPSQPAGLFATSFREQKPFLVNDLDEIKDMLPPQSLTLARNLGVRSFICCPIVCEGESLGVLSVDNLHTKKPLLQRDLSLLMGIAPVIGINIRNAMHLSQKLQVSEHLRQASKIASVGNWVWSSSGELRWSEELYRIFGLDPGTEITWENFFALVHPDDADGVTRAFTAFLQGEKPLDVEFRLARADGAKRYACAKGERIGGREGREDRFLGVIQDITDRKEAEGLVLRRTREIEAANRELEAFSSSVAHDLRSPLQSIEGFSKILLDENRNRLDSQGTEFLRRINAAARRMEYLIDDLLQLSRITRSELTYEPVDLSSMARDIAAELRHREPARVADFVIEAGCWTQGDPRLLRIVMDNLLGNAWKYSGRRERAVIEFGRTEKDGSPGYFVRDNGAGFDMDHADKLFAAFHRLHGVEEFEGTGIGLATVERILARHGGRIWAEAAVDKGATFYFTL